MPNAIVRHCRRLSLRTKFSLHIAASTTLLFTLLIPIIVHFETRAVLDEANRRGLQLAKIFAHASVQAIVADDFLVMRQIVDSVATEPDVLYAMIGDPNGRLLVHSDVRETGRVYTDVLSAKAWTTERPLRQDVWRPDLHLYDFAVPIYVLTERRAVVRVGLSVEQELADIRRTRNLILAFGFLSLMSGFAVAAWQARSVTRPLSDLVRDTDAIAAGDLGHQIAVRAQDEVGRLGESFARMARSLKSRIDELRDAQSAVVQKTRLAALGEISAAVAHETRNPLGAISNCVALLRKSPPRADDAELLEIIHDEVERLSSIVSDFLAFGRPRPPERRGVELRELIEGTLAALQRDKRWAAGITIELRYDATAACVHVDPDQLRQVLWNLFINAVEAMGTAGMLTVTTARGADGVRIEIGDTGPGIPAELRDRLFEPFQTGRPGGVGLGLAIVKRIVEEHGGRIHVESGLERGSRFVIALRDTAARA